MLIWDSKAWREERDKNLSQWMREDSDAVRVVVMLSMISELWDDLIDKDKEIEERRINAAFVAAMVELKLNSFYQKHQAMIDPIVMVGINAWMDANDLEKEPGADRRALAFYIRNFCYEVCSICALCAGGFKWLRSISLDMRMFFQHESYFTWEKRV